jgi:Fe2+ or Zn2+ uptake regulation protein
MRRPGQRMTAQRRAVIEVLGTSERLTPSEILRRARRRQPRVSLATVYRTLDLLADMGAVERLHEPDGCNSYVAEPAAGTHHHHVTCWRCGRVAQIPACELGDLVGAVAQQTGFEIDAHWLELRGLCSSCRNERAAEGEGRWQSSVSVDP